MSETADMDLPDESPLPSELASYFLANTLEKEKVARPECFGRVVIDNLYDQIMVDYEAEQSLHHVSTVAGDKFHRHVIRRLLVAGNSTSEATLTSLTGVSHSGKSHLIKQLARLLMLQPVVAGNKVTVPFIHVKAEPDAKPEILASLINSHLDKSGDEIASTRRALSHVWDSTRKNLAYRDTKLLVIDEFQNIVRNGSCRALHEIAGHLNGLLIKEKPITLVLAGTAGEINAFLTQPVGQHLANRHWNSPLKPFDWANVASGFAPFVHSLAANLSVTVPEAENPKSDFLHRLYIASGGHRGVTAKFICWAAVAARYETSTILSERIMQTISRQSHLGKVSAMGPTGYMDDMPNPFDPDHSVSMLEKFLEDRRRHDAQVDANYASAFVKRFKAWEAQQARPKKPKAA